MILRRLIGVMTFRLPTYREIAESSRLQWDSVLLVIALAVANGLAYAALHGPSFPAATRLIYPLLAWSLYGYLGSFVIRVLFKSDASAIRILNIFGYAQVAGALGVLLTTLFGGDAGASMLGMARILISALSLVLLLVTIVATILGFHEAGHMTRLQAVIVFLVCFAVVLLIESVISALAGGV